ncbi:MAG TPA: hypothetical protein VFN53_02335 [Acidobacteriaceae bacterium]|nr:hypothetical protein [Acidobacteriaceae bacterium]
MKRRTFLGLTGVGLSSGLLSSKMAAASTLTHLMSALAPQNAAAKPFGSGHFGEWITDAFGLPAYRYTCDQITDPKAITPVHKEWRSSTDHTHQVGNNRLVAAVSNYGYVQVRQDEGSPKFLNDYSPEDNHYGGGIGFLTDGETVLNTYYPGQTGDFERILGVGYMRKTVTSPQLAVDQVIYAPFGDDPVLISQVTVTNHSNAVKHARWVEYWGCHNYQFSYRSIMEAGMAGNQAKAAQLRRAFGGRFSHQFTTWKDGAGLLESQKFLGRTPEEEQAWQQMQAALKKSPDGFFGAPVPKLARHTTMEDLHPPATFLVSLDAPTDGVATNAAEFFAGGIMHPDGMKIPLNNALSAAGPESAFFLQRNLTLQPGQSRTMYFLYGYLPEGFSVDSLVAKYSADISSLWKRSSAEWEKDGLQFRVDSHPWVEREIAWHNYYLRSDLTFDSFFKEHMLSQGHVYQDIIGFQGAARDPLQHAMPFIFSDPGIVREIIRYTLKEIQGDGSIPYGIVGSGVPMPCIFRPSDLEMWLLWLTSEYVLATRDNNFLNEKIPTYPHRETTADDLTVGQLLARSYTHLTVGIGVGKHGLMRLFNGDWNDNVVVGHVPAAVADEVRQQGESVLNAAMACYVLDYYAQMLQCTGDTKLAAEAHGKAEAQRQAVREQWVGHWFRRAWLGEHLGWLGDDQIWLETQPWTVLGGAATPEQTRTLVASLNELVRKPSPIGALLLNKGDKSMENPVGTGTNGGIWPSINGTLIWALAQVDGDMAWDEWKKNCLALHAEAYPDIWYGIWSGPDTYNSVLSRYPGQTMFSDPDSTDPKERTDSGLYWTDYPVMNMHPHAWPLYSAAKLLGLAFAPDGLRFQPNLPLQKYEFSSPLLGFKKTRAGYSGWYAPAKAGNWSIDLRLPASELARLNKVIVNDEIQQSAPSAQGIHFSGESTLGKPLRWRVVQDPAVS